MKIVVLILSVGFLYGCKHEKSESEMTDTSVISTKAPVIEKNEVDEVDEMMPTAEYNTQEDQKMEDGDKMMQDHTTGMDLMQYTDYTDAKFAQIKGKQKFVVFFYAKWCGTCRAWESNVKQNLGTLPKNTVILKIDYDERKDLVKKWHVKSQSSVVFFNHTGEIVDTLVDPKLADLTNFFGAEDVENVKKAGAKYEIYSKARHEALKGKQKFVIFFYADWCATCRAWEKKFMSAVDTLPADTLVLKADYDNEAELKKSFGIKMQSVAAFVNADGSTAKTESDPSMESLTQFFSN